MKNSVRFVTYLRRCLCWFFFFGLFVVFSWKAIPEVFKAYLGSIQEWYVLSKIRTRVGHMQDKHLTSSSISLVLSLTPFFFWSVVPGLFHFHTSSILSPALNPLFWAWNCAWTWAWTMKREEWIGKAGKKI